MASGSGNAEEDSSGPVPLPAPADDGDWWSDNAVAADAAAPGLLQKPIVNERMRSRFGHEGHWTGTDANANYYRKGCLDDNDMFACGEVCKYGYHNTNLFLNGADDIMKSCGKLKKNATDTYNLCVTREDFFACSFVCYTA